MFYEAIHRIPESQRCKVQLCNVHGCGYPFKGDYARFDLTCLITNELEKLEHKCGSIRTVVIIFFFLFSTSFDIQKGVQIRNSPLLKYSIFSMRIVIVNLLVLLSHSPLFDQSRFEGIECRFPFIFAQ